MFYTPKYVNPGDIVTADDLNILEDQLERLWHFRGVIGSQQNLPASPETGDFYLLTADQAIQVYDGTQWNITQMPSSIDWDEILDKPLYWEQDPRFWLPRGTLAYFPQGAKDVVHDIKPEGYPGDVIKYFGFGKYRASSDGSLVVYEIKNDAPFSEINSILIEEPTTNYVPDGDFDTRTLQPPYESVVYDKGTLEFVTTTLPFGNVGTALKFTNNTTDQAVTTYPIDNEGALAPAQVGDTFTQSVYVKGEPGTSVGLLMEGLLESGGGNPQETAGQSFVLPDDDWHLISLTYTISSPYTKYIGVAISHNANESYILLWGWQLEKKPGPTTFIDGSRPNGSLKVLYDSAIRELANTGLVVSGWFKLPRYNSQNKYRLFTTNSLYLGKDAGGNWHIAANDGGTMKYQDLIDQNILEDGEWHFIVFRHLPGDTDKKVDVYIDGVLEASISLSNTLYYDSSQYYALGFGVDLDTTQNPPATSFAGPVAVAGLLLATPYDAAGNLVWSEEIIFDLTNWQHKFFWHGYTDEYIGGLEAILNTTIPIEEVPAVFSEAIFGKSGFGG